MSGRLVIAGQPGIASAGESLLASRGTEHKSGLVYRDALLGRARPFKWAWDQRVLLNYMNLLVGVEGIGKGNLIAWILARVTSGELPGDLRGTPRPVAIVGDEDSFNNVWVPRLHVAGANLKLVKYIEEGTTGTLDITKDADAIGEFVEDFEIAVVYFDQLLDNLGYTDNWKDKQVRGALAPLKRVASDRDVAILATLHPNKRGGSFRDMISGTPAFNALSRSSLLVAPHPNEPGRRVVVRPKGNYNAPPPAFEFTIDDATFPLGKGRNRRTISTSKITSVRETALTTEEVLGVRNRLREDSKAGLARGFLARLFEDRQPRLVEDVVEAGEKLGLDWKTLTEAATALRFTKTQERKFQGKGIWAPPNADEADVEALRAG
jgi:hypothetical protein